MTKSATDVMQEIIFSAVIDAIVALKAASKGVPNTLIRDLNTIHANTTFADLPADLQSTVGTSVRAAFTRLLKEGYTVSSGQAAPPRAPAPRRDGGGPPRGGRPPRAPRGEGDAPPRGGRPPRTARGEGDDRRPSRGGGRPNRNPKPRSS